MSVFKPGVLCLIIRHDQKPDRIGKVVVCMSTPKWTGLVDSRGHLLYRGNVVAVDAEWAPPEERKHPRGLPCAWLRPISDPDLDTKTVDEKFADANQEALEAALKELTESYPG